MSQLPPRLLERLKRRGIIKRVSENTQRDQTRPKSQTTEQQASQPKSSLPYGIEGDPDHEEIIAEDYSESSDEIESPTKDCDTHTVTDGHAGPKTNNEEFACKNDDIPGDHKRDVTARDNDSNDQLQDGSVLGCPNKYNIYHECSKYCIDHYSCPDSVVPTLEQRKQLALVLRAYPLPNEWQAVYDSGVKTFYFWNIVTNLVSWLPPIMNGFVSISADDIRRSMKADMERCKSSL